ncbi:hypothetical protein M426DRAFT_25385 [Hypoxylon sp. CI-4A]|nr:hypothetical protein M426DRAFT_25385 [Hypoxylon sp. CI-4A]
MSHLTQSRSEKMTPIHSQKIQTVLGQNDRINGLAYDIYTALNDCIFERIATPIEEKLRGIINIRDKCMSRIAKIPAPADSRINEDWEWVSGHEDALDWLITEMGDLEQLCQRLLGILTHANDMYPMYKNRRHLMMEDPIPEKSLGRVWLYLLALVCVSLFVTIAFYFCDDSRRILGL